MDKVSQYASFAGSNLTDADFANADVRGADFERFHRFYAGAA